MQACIMPMHRLKNMLTLDLALRAGTANAKDGHLQVAVEDDSPARLLANTPVAAQKLARESFKGQFFRRRGLWG